MCLHVAAGAARSIALRKARGLQPLHHAYKKKRGGASVYIIRIEERPCPNAWRSAYRMPRRWRDLPLRGVAGGFDGVHAVERAILKGQLHEVPLQ